MKYCINCRKKSEFVIQWGPDASQKEYVCSGHLLETVERIKAIEFFIVKIKKVSP